MSQFNIHFLENLNPAVDLGKKWEVLVSANPKSGIMQSLYWAEAKRKQGLDTIHLGFFNSDELIAGSIFYRSKKQNGTSILFAPEGPVLPWEDEKSSSILLTSLLDFLQHEQKQGVLIALRIEPRLQGVIPPYLREFSRAPVDLVPRETLYIDLSLSEDDLLAQMKEKGRYNIKLSQRNGIKVVEDRSPRAVDYFYTIMQEASERDGFALEPKENFRHLIDSLRAGGHAKILFSEHEEDLLGTLFLVTYGKRATYLYGGISNKKRNLMGGYALQWEAMKLAKQAGCSVYDFYGYDQFRSPDHRYARFSQFKSQFGGQPITLIGAQEYFYLDMLAESFIRAVNEVNITTNGCETMAVAR